MSVTLAMLKADKEKQLERKHETFIDHPTMNNAWQLAAAAEELLDVLREI
jgi:hypothetical protein